MKALSISGSRNLWTAVGFFVLAIVSVAIRLVIRFHSRLSLNWADSFILLSIITYAVWFALMVNYIAFGPGPGTLDLNQIVAEWADGGQTWGVALLKMLYVSDLFFGLTITFVKLSILCLYYSLFSISRRFRIWNYVVAGFCVLWFILFTFLNVFQCHPVAALWETFGSTQYCLPSGVLWLSFELPNLFLDIAILLLPVTMLGRLQLPRAKRWSVAGVFLLGGLVCVASIVRLTYIWHPATPEVVDVSNTQILSSVQLGTAVLCASLLTYAPLLKVIRKAVNRLKLVSGMTISGIYKSNHTLESAAGVAGRGDSRDLGVSPYYRMHDLGNMRQDIKISKGDSNNSSVPGGIPENSILVHQTLYVS